MKLNDVLVKCPTVLAFDVNVTAVADVFAAAAAAAMKFVLDPCTVQMRIHFRTVALPSNVYLGKAHLLTALDAAVDVARPTHYQIIRTIYHDSCQSDSVVSPKCFECLF